MMSETEDAQVHVIHSANGWLTPEQYAEQQDKTLRTVRRWLADEEVPGAWQDPITKKWNIPAGAERVVSEVPKDLRPRPVQYVMPPAGEQPGNGLVLHEQSRQLEPTLLEREPTRLEDLEEESTFLSIAAAAEYLGIPQESILEQPDVFGVMPVGRKLPDGTRVKKVPKATIKKFEG
jgi:hypothetical protein